MSLETGPDIDLDKRISKKYFSELMNNTIAHPFYPASEYALTLRGFPIYGYPLPPEIRHKAKKVVSDVDYTLTRQQIFYVYIKLLSKVNDGIEKREDEIFECVKQMRSGNVDGPTEGVEEQFSESGVTYRQHEWACINVPYYVGLKPNSIPFISTMKSMYYDFLFFSGSPNLAVEHFVGRNMTLAGFNLESAKKCVTGTEYVFDEDGVFVGINPMLYEYKHPAVERKLKETVGTTKGINTVLSDDIDDLLHMMQSFINPLILTGEATELPTDVFIALPEANSDMMLIPPVIRRAEMGLCFSIAYPISVQKESLRSALRFRETCESIEKGNRNLAKLRDKALHIFNDYISLVQELFTTSPGFTGIDSIVRELETSTSREEIKSAASNLLNGFREYSPHPDIAKKVLDYF